MKLLPRLLLWGRRLMAFRRFHCVDADFKFFYFWSSLVTFCVLDRKRRLSLTLEMLAGIYALIFVWGPYPYQLRIFH